VRLSNGQGLKSHRRCLAWWIWSTLHLFYVRQQGETQFETARALNGTKSLPVSCQNVWASGWSRRLLSHRVGKTFLSTDMEDIQYVVRLQNIARVDRVRLPDLAVVTTKTTAISRRAPCMGFYHSSCSVDRSCMHCASVD